LQGLLLVWQHVWGHDCGKPFSLCRTLTRSILLFFNNLA